MNSIEKDFFDTLQILTDFKVNPKFIVAFSGGTDSLALLCLLIDTFGKQSVVPVYVNHNLRNSEELKKEIELNEYNCKKLGVSLIVREIEKGQIEKESKGVGIEAAARKRRYLILEEERILNSCNYILSAHHKDDQIETVLMRIIKGSPITGLRGISEKWNNVLRPMLEFSKSELEDYLLEKNLIASFDSTNKNNEYKRNEIRNIILPQLKKIMPDCESRILKIRDYAVSQCYGVQDVQDCVPLQVFRTYTKTKKMMCLYSMWDNVLGSSLPQVLIERVIDSVDKKTLSKESANGGTFYSYNGMLYLINNENITELDDFSMLLDQKCELFNLPFNLFIKRIKDGKSTDLSIDFSKFKGQPRIRFAKDGDTIRLKDGSKTVGKLLQDMKVPAVFRSRVPVVEDDDGLCIVFGSAFGGKDRICAKLRTSLALDKYYKYICYKGNYYER